jgi:hypothetical protein
MKIRSNKRKDKGTKSVVSKTAGIFKTDEPAKTAEELRVLAEEAIVQDVMERAGGR